MDPSLRKKMLAVYAVVLLLGVLLSTLIYLQGQSALRATMLLIDQDQPALESLARFKIAVVVEEPILYEYYATTDRQRFQQCYRDNREEVERGLGFVRETFPRSVQLAAIEEKDALSRNFTSQLDDTLNRNYRLGQGPPVAVPDQQTICRNQRESRFSGAVHPARSFCPWRRDGN